MKLTLKFMAFTLAETLIVIGVIGIVSALTLPNLNSSTGDKEKVAKVEKIYQNLNDAFSRAEAVYGPFDTWFVNDTDEQKITRFGERLTEFMKVSKNCETTNGQGCFSSSKVFNLKSSGDFSDSLDSKDKWYRFITADGTSVALATDLHEIFVDIDGSTKGKNKMGNDIFMFTINESSGIVPSGLDQSFTNLLSDLNTAGSYAAAWIVKYDNADYLKISSVSGATATCTNQNTMNESNPRCK